METVFGGSEKRGRREAEVRLGGAQITMES